VLALMHNASTNSVTCAAVISFIALFPFLRRIDTDLPGFSALAGERQTVFLNAQEFRPGLIAALDCPQPVSMRHKSTLRAVCTSRCVSVIHAFGVSFRQKNIKIVVFCYLHLYPSVLISSHSLSNSVRLRLILSVEP
jgi:hypothetical protein